MYDYEAQKHKLFTDEGQRLILQARDHAERLIKTSGAATCGKLMSGIKGACDSWLQLACIDRLVELGDLQRVTPRDSVSTQNEVYVSPRWSQ